MSVKPQEEKLSFQAEVKQLLQLVTHSLYSNKEIFLRELISNASDAADKLRFAALSDDALYEGDSALWIKVKFDPQARTVTICDNGIGMTREEVISNLGTIAKSGTREFLSALSGDQAKDAHLIGQFGVGFYSAFVVADKVEVRTRRAGMRPDQGVFWESAADGEYTIKNIEVPQRGTEIILHLKADEDEFLEYWRLREIITKYSDHIVLPIYMPKQKEEGDKLDTSAMAAKEGEEKEVNEEVKTETGTEGTAVAEKTQPAEVTEEIVNRATALWALPKKDIKDEDYKELYKHITRDFSDPLLWSHNTVEGKLEYITLLYIPEHAPFDLWHRDHRYGLKLYVQRVFIMDNAELLLPNYLRFARGIVDSKDLPLNVSREILQSNKIIDSIRAGVIKRILDMLDKLAVGTDESDREKYAKFWSAFGQVLKEGLIEDATNKERIAKLLRFASTHNDSESDGASEAQNVSLDDYISRMSKGQDKIYYITAETFKAAKNSPHLEIFRKKGIEVLLLTDRIDEWMLSGLYEYAGKQLQSVAKGDLDLSKVENRVAGDGEKDAAAEQNQTEELKKDEQAKEIEFASVIKQMKDILGDKVSEVRLSSRLTDSPACLVAGEYDMSMYLQRIMSAAGQNVPRGKPTLEINAQHPIVERMKNEADEQKFADWTQILFDQALLAEGGHLDDPASFVKRLNSLLLR